MSSSDNSSSSLASNYSYSMPIPNSIFTMNPDWEMILFGALYVIFSVPLIPLQIVVMMALHNKEKSTKNATFKLMNLLNSLEIGHIFCHFLSSFFLFFPVLVEEYEVFVRVIGAALNTFWIAELPIMALLAVSRIFIFQSSKHMFSSRPEKLALIAKIVLSIILSWMLFVFLTGCITQNFMFYPPSWQYDMNAPYAPLFSKLEIITVSTSLGISYFSYLVITYLIYVQKKQGASSSSSKTNERSILIQYTFTVTYIMVYLILWHFGRDWFNMDTPGDLAFVNCFWIGGAYISPVTLLILNISIRKECKMIIKCKNEKTVSVTWITTATS